MGGLNVVKGDVKREEVNRRERENWKITHGQGGAKALKERFHGRRERVRDDSNYSAPFHSDSRFRSTLHPATGGPFPYKMLAFSLSNEPRPIYFLSYFPSGNFVISLSQGNYFFSFLDVEKNRQSKRKRDREETFEQFFPKLRLRFFRSSRALSFVPRSTASIGPDHIVSVTSL